MAIYHHTVESLNLPTSTLSKYLNFIIRVPAHIINVQGMNKLFTQVDLHIAKINVKIYIYVFNIITFL